MTNACLSRQNNFFVMTKVCLSWQKYGSHDQAFVTTNMCLSWQNFCCDKHTFVMTKDVLSWQKYACCGKKKLTLTHTHTNTHTPHNLPAHIHHHLFLCHDKCMFVATKQNSWQKYVCRDKVVMIKLLSQQTCVCHDKTFVVTSILLSWQKMCFVMTKVCLLRQKKILTKLCLSQQIFVETEVLLQKKKKKKSTLLSWQKRCFVLTKMTLVAAPANNTFPATAISLLTDFTFSSSAHFSSWIPASRRSSSAFSSPGSETAELKL